MIAVIDYGMGNLRSVSKALEKLGAEVKVTQDSDMIRSADKIILPGVGAFGDAICELRKRNLIKTIKESVTQGKPFLGICLGLQLLFKSSAENPGVHGLGIFDGTVEKFSDLSSNGTVLKVPHMGWNKVSFTHEPEAAILQGVKNGAYFYFVHSFYGKPSDPEIIQGTADYGVTFPAVIGKRKTWATQFHPEKSQDEGLKILANFIKL